MHDPIKTLQDRIEMDNVPTTIEVLSTGDGPAVVVRFGRYNPAVFPISDGEEVTDDPDALKPDSVLIELEKRDTRHGAPAVYDRAGVRYIRDIRPDHEESARYVHVSGHMNNDTSHPHHHLVSDHGADRKISREYYLFE